EFHPDREHEKADTDLTEESQGLKGRRSENALERLRSEEPEEGRPKQNASDHFAYHGRLTDADGKPARDAGHGNDDEDLEKETTKRIRAVLIQIRFGGIEERSVSHRRGVPRR